MEWTDESIARLRALWQEGHSTAEIGRRMGITKNAVVGKAHRLDLSARPSPIRKSEVAPGAAPAQPKRPVADKPRTVDIAAEDPVVLAQPVMSTSLEHAVTAAPPAMVATDAPTDARDPGLATLAAELPQASAISPAVEASPVQALSAIAASTPASTLALLPTTPEPEFGDNVRLLRPDMPNPAVTPAAPRDVAEPVRAEPVRTATRVAEPREPRRRGLSCCWPLGEPGTKGFHFCGGDPTPGKPYCAEHAALAYVKLRDRRDSVA